MADNGSGIEPEFLPFVFDRFRQGDGTTTRNHSGLGLGLSIAKQLVEAHKGTIRAESAGKGKGHRLHRDAANQRSRGVERVAAARPSRRPRFASTASVCSSSTTKRTRAT